MDTGFRFHADTKVNVLGERPSEEDIKMMSASLISLFKDRDIDLTTFEEKWFEVPSGEVIYVLGIV